MMGDIRVDGLSKRFGLHQVLDNVSFRLDAGGRYCLMGPSGVGKTSLLRLMMGLEQADSGRILGVDPRALSVMFQEDRLSGTLNPVENVALVHPDRHVSKPWIREELSELLPERSLAQPVRELSGGMRRRVSLACAVLTPSTLILLDEPFTGLDWDTKHTVVGYLRSRTAGRTVLAATHGRDDAGLLDAHTLTLSSSDGKK